MPAGCFDPRAQDAHFLGSFLKGDSGMLSSSFLIQLYLLHSTLHKHSRNLFHLVAFSTLLLRDCPLGTKLRTLLLSSGGVQQKKTVRRKANTQSCVQVSSGLQAEYSQPPSAWSWSWSQHPPRAETPGTSWLFGQIWLSYVTARRPTRMRVNTVVTWWLPVTWNNQLGSSSFFLSGDWKLVSLL